jgi:hypothetical protein
MPIFKKEFKSGTVEVSGDESVANDEEGQSKLKTPHNSVFKPSGRRERSLSGKSFWALILAPHSWIERGIHWGRSLTA